MSAPCLGGGFSWHGGWIPPPRDWGWLCWEASGFAVPAPRPPQALPLHSLLHGENDSTSQNNNRDFHGNLSNSHPLAVQINSRAFAATLPATSLGLMTGNFGNFREAPVLWLQVPKWVIAERSRQLAALSARAEHRNFVSEIRLSRLETLKSSAQINAPWRPRSTK